MKNRSAILILWQKIEKLAGIFLHWKTFFDKFTHIAGIFWLKNWGLSFTHKTLTDYLV
jgi:hypothetical protein